MGTLTKQSYIIGFFALAIALFYIAVDGSKLYTKLKTLDGPKDSRDDYFKDVALRLGAYVTAAFIAILLIWGIKQKIPMATVPAILCPLGAMGYTIFFVGYNLIFMPFGQFELLQKFLPFLGLEVLIFYVLVSMFRQIKHQKLEQERLENSQNPN
ncbi:uncharacterized protein LOC101889339 [Musca domestica]|uniref:Uncharacterized protein LOC101889339 n=1 Tax=Musca domestica TaxID=7370 RepID=A0A1I8MML1_MUSDO|nr:uncharacterized protein LOC101889339 [Musca domestica]